MLGSARVPRVGFGVAPKQAFSNASWRLVFSQPKKVRDRENALASTRDVRAPHNVIACEIFRFAQNETLLFGIACTARTIAIHFARLTSAAKSRLQAG
jgi:hypothetical protein